MSGLLGIVAQMPAGGAIDATSRKRGAVVLALLIGGIGDAVSQRAVFLLAPVSALLSTAAILSIPRAAIDTNRARGLDDPDEDGPAPSVPAPSGPAVLAQNRPLLVFASCVMLFHFANAPLLPLVGQKLAQANPTWAMAMMSSRIVAAQSIMLPTAVLVGRTADRFGRKPLLLLAFAVLPVRAVLYTLSDVPAWLIGVQLLDGVGAGILGAITPLLVADLTRGTGRFNLAEGAVATAQGVGAALERVGGRGHRGPPRLLGRFPRARCGGLRRARCAAGRHAGDGAAMTVVAVGQAVVWDRADH